MFSKPGVYDAVGLFTVQHIIAIIICFLLIALFVSVNHKMSSEKFHADLRLYSAVLTVLEAFKISWTWINVGFRVDLWVPLYFCSLFIFALWFVCSNKKFLQEIGFAYIGYAGIICGIVFIVSPSTSFTTYPIFHFQCLYSMFYHSLMVYCGIMVFLTKKLDVSLRTVYKYWLFCAIFIIPVLIINPLCHSNLMFFSNPYRIPLPILLIIHNQLPILYTIIMVLAHISLAMIVFGINALIEHIAMKHGRTEPLEDDVAEDEKQKEQMG